MAESLIVGARVPRSGSNALRTIALASGRKEAEAMREALEDKSFDTVSNAVTIALR